MSVQIQQRDEQVLKFIYACRVVTSRQILNRHFPGRHKTAGYARIRALIKAGLIRFGATTVNGHLTRYIQPLPKCWDIIGTKWTFDVDHPLFKSESPEHDIRVTECMMRIEKLKGFRSFFTENLLQSSSALAEDPRFGALSRIQSDGALTIIGKNGVPEIYAFEFELNKKNLERYREKITSYFLAKGIDGVFYVSPKTEVATALAKVEAEFGEHRMPLVWVATEESALRHDHALQFVNRLGEKIEFK